MQVIFDSNIWVAFLNHHDSLHAKAIKIFRDNEGKIIIPEYILLEITTVVSLRANFQIAQEFLRLATTNNDVEILPSSLLFLVKLLDFLKTSDFSKLSFADHALVLLSHRYKVLTFDQDLNKVLHKH